MTKINIIGAGLAGCEAAYQCAKANLEVTLYEMRPTKMTPAHTTSKFAELVCSNSLRSNSLHNAVGLLKEELRIGDSIIMQAADFAQIPSGSALAVDRDLFSSRVEEILKSFDNLKIVNQEVTDIDDSILTIVATGPLTSDALSDTLMTKIESESLHFFDAIAPVIEASSINREIVYAKSRYDKGEADYLNCPMTKEEFMTFYHALITAKTVELKDFEDEAVFEGCIPIEVMAKRGIKTLTFGPLKPVGLQVDHQKPFAVVQLRQDNAAKTLYNLVGFQTHLTWGEQERVLKLIPGLEDVKIVRYGVMHRNTYINSPLNLNQHYQLKKFPNIFIAGQLSGVEGYVESCASGFVAARAAIELALTKDIKGIPVNSMMGSMGYYVSHANPHNFQPMNANFGILRTTSKNKEERVREALSAFRSYEETFR